MSSRSFRSLWVRFSFFFSLIFILIVSSIAMPPAAAQTTQPFLFAGTYNSSNNSSGFATLLRNSTTGTLALLPNTVVSFKDPCNPSTIDPTGNFLFGVCGEGVAMYTLDPPPESSPKLPPRLTPLRSPPARAASWLPPKAPASMFDRRNLRWAQAHAA